MVEIIGVRFNSAGKIYYFDPVGEEYETGKKVLVETARGIEIGQVALSNKEVDDAEIVAPLKPIIREVTEDDVKRIEENKEKEKEAYAIAVDKIREHNIDMKLVDVEYTFDRSKILFYFTADGRVDFRELVKSLASVFHTRIELRQIGVRDEARQIGSYGICGRNLCCATFLNDFKPVSIKMAKEQGLSLNPTKISGTCGRLMCCLQYEQNAYDDMIKRLPHKGAVVETADGRGSVSDVATLKGEVRVKFDDGESLRFGNYKLGEFKLADKKYGEVKEEAVQSQEIYDEDNNETEQQQKKSRRGGRDRKRVKSKGTEKDRQEAPAIKQTEDDSE